MAGLNPTIREKRLAYKRAYNKAYRAAHGETVRAGDRAYHAAHREEKRAYKKAHYVAHREEVKARMKAYRAAHREEIKTRDRTYYAAHREEIKARCTAYGVAHREEQSARMKVYYAAHREELQAYRTRIRKPADALIAAFRSDGCCLCAEKDPACLEAHHIDPTTKENKVGYLTAAGQIQLLADELKKCACVCSNCHAKIHRKDF
jgi:hypothetical protein